MKYISHKISQYKGLFSVLGSESRLGIITSLLDGPKSVTEIVQATGLSQTAVSHDLKKLAECQFVRSVRKGKQRVYSVNTDTVKPLFANIDRHLGHYCKHNCK